MSTVTEPAIGQRVRYRGHKSACLDPKTEDVLATLSEGVEGTVVGYRPDHPGPCPDCEGDDCEPCDGTGTLPPDPTWVVEWECPEGTWRRLIRADGRGWEPTA